MNCGHSRMASCVTLGFRSRREPERHALPIRRDFGLERAVERRPPGGEDCRRGSAARAAETANSATIEFERRPASRRGAPARSGRPWLRGAALQAPAASAGGATQPEALRCVSPARMVRSWMSSRFAVAVPGDLARRLVDRNGSASGLFSRTLPAPDRRTGRPSDSSVPSRREARVELEGDRPLGEQRRRLLVEGLEVGEADVVGFERERRLRRRPPPRASIVHRPAGPVARSSRLASSPYAIEHEVEVLVGHGAAASLRCRSRSARWPSVSRSSACLAPAIASAPARISAAKFRLSRPDASGSASAIGAAASSPADRDRQRAVGGDLKAETEIVEFEPPHPDLAKRRPATDRRRSGRAAPTGPCARRGRELQVAEAEADAQELCMR